MANKYQGKRLVPEYLITKLEEIEPGAEYTAGDNITIEDGVISATDTTYTAGPGIEINTASNNLVRTKISINGGLNYDNNGNMIADNSVVAFKSDIVTSYNDLTDKPSIPTKTSDLQNDSNFIQNATQQQSVVLQTESSNFDMQSNFITVDATDEVSGDSSSITIAGEQIDIDTPVLYYNTVEVATINDIPTTATSSSTVTPSTIQLTFTYSDNTTETITVMTGASVTTTTTLS